MTGMAHPRWAAVLRGTYFPDTDRHGMPSFRTVMRAVSDAWENGGTRCWANRPGSPRRSQQRNPATRTTRGQRPSLEATSRWPLRSTRSTVGSAAPPSSPRRPSSTSCCGCTPSPGPTEPTTC